MHWDEDCDECHGLGIIKCWAGTEGEMESWPCDCVVFASMAEARRFIACRCTE